MSTDQFLRVVLELASPLIALLAGISALKYMQRFFRVLLLQLLFLVCFYMISYVVTAYQEAKDIPLNNQWLMNIQMVVEGVLLFMAGFIFFRHKAIKSLIFISMMVFISIAFGQAFLKGGDIYFNYADVAECILMTTLYSAILLKALINKEEYGRVSVLLISSGLILYFACSIPLISLLHILWENEPETAGFIFEVVNTTISNIRYLLAAIAFFALRRTIIH